jgi:hypothetical protein
VQLFDSWGGQLPPAVSPPESADMFTSPVPCNVRRTQQQRPLTVCKQS